MRPNTERRTVFANFEYRASVIRASPDYVQANYATTGLARTAIVHIQAMSACASIRQGVAATPGGAVRRRDGRGLWRQWRSLHRSASMVALPVPDIPRNPLWSNPNFRAFLGNQPNGRVPPYFIRPDQNGSTNHHAADLEFHRMR